MDKFKPEIRKSPESEFSTEEGIKESVRRIQELFKALDRSVYVVINGSNINVGKTFIMSALQVELYKLGIPTTHMDLGNSKKQVVFHTSQFIIYPGTADDYRQLLLSDNPDLSIEDSSYGDLYIGIYRPDKPFFLGPKAKEKGAKPVADIMICNKEAHDKSHSI